MNEALVTHKKLNYLIQYFSAEEEYTEEEEERIVLILLSLHTLSWRINK